MQQIERPIGLEEFCTIVERVCNQAAVYRRTRPKHLLVYMDAGSGRTTAVSYLTDMYKQYGVLPFTSGLDDYVEVVLEASSSQKIQEGFAEFSSAAIYENDFSNVAAIDISDLSKYLNGPQLQEFLKEAKALCHTACVIFFVSAKPTLHEEKLVKRLLEALGSERIESVVMEDYTKDELVMLIKKRMNEYGIEIENEQKLDAALVRFMVRMEICELREALSCADALVQFAYFDRFTPVVNEKSVKAMACVWKTNEKVGGQK